MVVTQNNKGRIQYQRGKWNVTEGRYFEGRALKKDWNETFLEMTIFIFENWCYKRRILFKLFALYSSILRWLSGLVFLQWMILYKIEEILKLPGQLHRKYYKSQLHTVLLWSVKIYLLIIIFSHMIFSEPFYKCQEEI